MAPSPALPGAAGLRRALRFAPVVRSLIAILRTGTEYIVYNNDACLGKDAPSLSTLDVMHNGVEGSDAPSLDYADATATVVCFWSKIHKGNYPTINLWSDIASRFKEQEERVERNPP